MLVLTRRIGESIVIDGGIVVTVSAIDGQKIRLLVSAPPEIPVDREEIHHVRQRSSCTERPTNYVFDEST